MRMALDLQGFATFLTLTRLSAIRMRNVLEVAGVYNAFFDSVGELCCL